MNYDGASLRSAVKLQAMPFFVAERDIEYAVKDFDLSLPNYRQTDRIILTRCTMSICVQYKFTAAPLLFTLELVDTRTDTILASSPYGQEDFSVGWNTMTETFLLDEWNSLYYNIRLVMQDDDTQSFVIRKRSFYSINSI